MSDIEGLAKFVEGVTFAKEALTRIEDRIESVRSAHNEIGFVWSELTDIKNSLKELKEVKDRPQRVAAYAETLFYKLMNVKTNATNAWWREQMRLAFNTVTNILNGREP